MLKLIRAASDRPAGKRVRASHVICLGFSPDWLRKKALNTLVLFSFFLCDANTKQSQNNPQVTSEMYAPRLPKKRVDYFILCSVQEYKQYYGCCRQ